MNSVELLVVLYARVSEPRSQDKEDKASIDQQLADMRALCERMGWRIAEEFVEREYYKATQNPNKGKMVNPSGERADRPQLLAMLEVVKTGGADAILCWRDDRLVRHPRVAVALEDALDIGDAKRDGKPKIEIRDATGAVIDRFTLSIKATIWREENKRRAERVRMGKMATLDQGYWPGTYRRLGYKMRRGPRGRIIEIAEDEVPTVLTIFEMYDAGVSIRDIRRHLIRSNASQKGYMARIHEWDLAVIYRILNAEDYTGTATWHFGDGLSMSIEIPQIVPHELWERVQARLERNKRLSPRNAKHVYVLQGLLYCGDCGRAMHARQKKFYYRNGERRAFKTLVFEYQCSTPLQLPDVPHPRPHSRYGPSLDWQVWRRLVDYGIQRPDFITGYILDRQAELQAQGDSLDGDIAHAHHELAQIAQERKAYHKQKARGKMTQQEYDELIDETEESRLYWESEIVELQELRDNMGKVRAGIDYVNKLLASIQTILPQADMPPKELKRLPEERRREILKIRQGIIRALVEKVTVWASGQVMIDGALDGSEAAQFELGSS